MLAIVVTVAPTLTARAVDVAIVGGGPCGLATALALSKAPCLKNANIAVFEADTWKPKGASIQISKAGWSALENLDEEAASRIRATGAPVTQVSLRSFSGKSLTPLPLTFLARIIAWFFALLRFVGLKRALTRAHTWHDVRTVLRDRVRETLGESALQSGSTLESLDAGTDDVRLGFGGGDEVRAKVVLACDGTRSAVRRLLPGESDDELLLSEGRSVWRGQAPTLDTRGAATFYKDGDCSGLVFPAGTGQGSSWSFIAPAADGRAATSEEARERLAKALPSPLDATLQTAIDASASVLEHKLVVRDFENQPWASSAPRVAFLGDAAHPLRPTGEGTALALEDAWTMGDLAASADSAAEFCAPATLRRYEERRLPRVRAVSDAVRAAANRFYDQSGGGAAAARSTVTASQAMAEHPFECAPL